MAIRSFWEQLFERAGGYDVIGHLIYGERMNWLLRAKHILAGER